MITFFKLFSLLNIIILCSGLLGMGFHWFLQKSEFNFSPASGLKVQYSLLAFAILVFVVCIPRVVGWVSIEKEMDFMVSSVGLPLQGGSLAFKGKFLAPTVFNNDSESVVSFFLSSFKLNWLAVGFFGLFLLSILRFFCLLVKTVSFCHSGIPIRRFGNITICTHNRLQSPFAFSFLNQSFVGLPVRLIDQPCDMRMALAHELAHLRFSDSSVTFTLQLLEALLIFNPIYSIWVSRIEELQEMRVDQFLITNKKINKKQYGSCLFHVAHDFKPMKFHLVGATGMGLHLSNKQLSRRMVKMKYKYVDIGWKPILGFFGVSLISLTVMAMGVSHGLAENRLSVADAKSLMASAQITPGFPVDVNPQVLQELHRYTKTKKGRRFSVRAFANYETQKPLIDNLFMMLDMPKELKAVAFVESGFKNLPEGKNPVRAAGVWQFIRSTAKAYNMEVSSQYDDRQDVAIQTTAALNYFRKLHRQFKDWRLAVMAYNMGEENLEKGIEKTGTRDPWLLMDHGIQGDLNYLPKVQAAMILMEHPELLD